MKQYWALCLLLAMAVIGNSQVFPNAELIYSSEEVLIYTSNEFYNYLEDAYMGSYCGLGDFAEDSDNCFIIHYYPAVKRFVVTNNAPGMMYEGIGSVTKLDGRHKLITPSNEIQGEFKNGFLEGEVTINNKRSRSVTSKHYKKGKLDGQIITRDSSNNITYYCEYKNGVRDGLEYSLHYNKAIKYYKHNKDGKPMHTPYYIYDPDGVVIDTIY